MQLKGTKRIEIVGISDKRQITALFPGESLPLQLIYQGKTAACLPQFKFPDVTGTKVTQKITCLMNKT